MFLFINLNQLILFPIKHKIQSTLILNTFPQQLYTNIYHQIVYINIMCHIKLLFIKFDQLILFPRRHKIQRTLILNTSPQQVYTNLYHQIIYIDIICHITFF